MANGRPSVRPVLLCAVAALAGHAAALLGLATGPAATGPGAPTGAPERLLHVSLRPESRVESPAAPLAAEQAPQPPEPPSPTAAAEGGAAAAPSRPPAFVEGPPDVPLPDELLPAGGVQLRAFVRVGAEGQVLDVATALYPGDASAAYAVISERALADARLTAAGHDQTHCLVLDFQPGMPAPRWAWRPDAQVQQCLTSQAPTTKPLPAP